MRYFLCLLCSFGYWFSQAQTVRTIVQARTLADGTTVTVRGRMTGDATLGRLRFVEDGSAGLGVFPGTGSTPLYDERYGWGDSVEITGTLSTFRGLRQISPVTNIRMLAPKIPLSPRPLRALDVGEAYEGQYGLFACVAIQTSDSTVLPNKFYDAFDTRGQTFRFSFMPDSRWVGRPFPKGAVSLEGIVNQSDVHYLLATDLRMSASTCLQFVRPVAFGGHTTESISLHWATNTTAQSWVRYGLSADAVGLVRTLPAALEQNITLTGLQSATIYWAQVGSVAGRDTLWSPIRPFVTQSNSSGTVQVYFNRPLLPAGPRAAGESAQACIDAIVARIDAARTTIDVAMYNVNLSVFVDALKRAHARGVTVRYVAAADTRSLALQPPPPFPVIYGNDLALMHNKFVVIDRDSPQGAWVLGGSLNWTQGNVFDDFNNAVWIQDQALARVYTLEFEEMWTKNLFGIFKTDNTPHELTVGGRRLECYFSPSDRPTERIVQALQTAQSTAEFALLTFTKDEVAAMLVILQQRGVQVRGMLENINDAGSEFGFLTANQVPVLPHRPVGVLHHKYVVVDAQQPDSDPLVLTGSHNWSVSAEQRNDENMLIFHNATVAALFHAEFEARWQEVKSLTTAQSQPFLGKMWPNPAQNAVHFTFPEGEKGTLLVCNAWGQPVVHQSIAAPQHTVATANWPAGYYQVYWQTNAGVQTTWLIVH